ncbi:nucleoid occlusion factor SlmA [Psychrobium sp. 1_MG-2023]|uniref:nucleoid occlusion factor SlmA n=1 Tax=Psychrobium sp. 1_MG-2023 TaxID=3062624 RepID=UPI000C342B52|nr:nucleoid occlusion factor SlmA [Psychrobium sp. 1_MG-2023]MDP2562546.1 nucleoid occlusion factor SlmA [Psychrobium sp. 1_MG-2023]PKF57963.1 nucleoid occlusion factor SlmA [Alteromonadales bacterium alter-6D02]
MAATKKSNRREQILQSLAHMLEIPGNRITTAKLAAEVGVSEAALYRHFPSKARMFEGLIEFIEDSILSRVNIITSEEKNTLLRCHHLIQLVLLFAEKNPGITRILTGDALLGEHDRLRERISLLFEKLETHLKQILRERKLREGKSFDIDEAALANMLLAYAEGRVNQYVRSGFKVKPTDGFEQQWQQFAKLLG